MTKGSTMNKNVEKFQQMLSADEDLRNELQAAADAYNGSKADDRAVFENVILPAARSVGVEFTYEEACEAILDGRDLTDDELELVAGGVGTMYQRLVSGMLAATMVFSSIPLRAFAQQKDSGSGASAQTIQAAEADDPEDSSEVGSVNAGDYNRTGTYTVTLKEADFAKGESEQGDGKETKEAQEALEEGEDEQGDGKETKETQKAQEAQKALEEAKAARDDASRELDEAREAEERARADADAQQEAADEDGAVEDAEAQPEAADEDGVELADDDRAVEDAEAQPEAADEDGAESAAESDALARATEAREQAEENLAKAEEAVKAAEEKVAGLEGQAEEKKDLTFADVKAEDVKVGYLMIPDADSDAAPEIREAQINALSNDGGALTISFTDPDAATNGTAGYIVTVDDLGLTANVSVDITKPVLSVESGGVKSDVQSCDVTLIAEDGTFAAGISVDDIRLGGSFRDMTISGMEASGDTLTCHLAGSPVRDYETEGAWVDGQVTVEAQGFENSPAPATACVPIDLPDEAFDLGGEEALSAATVSGEVEHVDFEGETARAALSLYADMGAFNDVKAQDITLEDEFAGGKVESVAMGEDGSLMVEVSFPKGGQAEDDYLYAGTLRFAAGTMNDESGEAAGEVSCTLLLEPEDMGKAGDDAEDAAKKAEEAKKKAQEAKKKAQEAKAKKIGGIGEGFKYAAGWVEKVDPVLGKMSEFASGVFGMAASYVKGDWLDIAKGGIGLLQICGIIPQGPKETTAADVLKEVKDLRKVVDSIDLKTDEIAKEGRENRYTQTSVRVKQMQDRIASAYAMIDKAADILANRKDNPMEAPAAEASNDEAVKYNNELRKVMLEEQAKAKQGKTKDTMFIDAEETMSKLREDLSTVCKWLSVKSSDINAGANPIDVFDKLVSMKFNWDTQGYYARAAFRTELDVTIKASWAVVSTFYGATDPGVTAKYQPELDNVKTALQQIAARPAGQSPEDVAKLNNRTYDPQKDYNTADTYINVYSPSLGFAVKRVDLLKGARWLWTDERVSDAQIAEYRKRLQGTPREDLALAGLDVNKDAKPVGIAFRHKATQWTKHAKGWLSGKAWTRIKKTSLILTDSNELKEFVTHDLTESIGTYGSEENKDVSDVLFYNLNRG